MNTQLLTALNDMPLANQLDAQQVTPNYYVVHYAEFLPRYIAKGNPSEDTLNSYVYRINVFMRWCISKNWHPLNIQDYQMRLYRDYLMQQNYASESMNIMIVAVRSFFHIAIKLGFIAENPCDDITTPFVNINKQSVSFYTLQQMQKICSVFKDLEDEFLSYRNTLILYLMGVEGMRNVEVHRACVEDINWDLHIINVRGKGSKGRVDPIYPCEETFELLKKYVQAIDKSVQIKKEGKLTPLILSASNNHQMGRISRNGIRWIMNKALTAVGLKRPGQSCHVFRHSCGTNLYKNTKDLRLVQETLRQKDPKVTARYAHLNERMENRATSALALHDD